MSNQEPRPVRTATAYAEAYAVHQPITITDETPLMGRIMRSKTPEGFERLAADDRKLVFAMGPDGLQKLPGRPLRAALADIGLNPGYVEGRIRQGYQYKLAVFEADTRRGLATWRNVLRQIVEVSPELAGDVARHAAELEQKPFSHYQDQLPQDMDQINLDGPDNPLYMTEERYRALPRDERALSALALRRLLANEYHLGPRFGGEGYTVAEDGSRGLKEYVIPNGPIRDLQNPVVLPISLSGVPTPEK